LLHPDVAPDPELPAIPRSGVTRGSSSQAD
jgi:hypothetical protein